MSSPSIPAVTTKTPPKGQRKKKVVIFNTKSSVAKNTKLSQNLKGLFKKKTHLF